MDDYELFSRIVNNTREAFQVMNLDEFRHVIDLLENPPESGPLREALDKYKGPRDYAAMRSEIDFYESSQNEEELASMLEVIRGSKSLLEVGSRFGGTLVKMAKILAPGSTITSVDAPICDSELHIFKPQERLEFNCDKIRAMGHTVNLIMADSQVKETVERVRAFGPFDFGFIDADHSYKGVKTDWENYGPMCKVIGFHDIINQPSEVDRLWAELKPHFKHAEFTQSLGKHQLGIGIIFREQA